MSEASNQAIDFDALAEEYQLMTDEEKASKLEGVKVELAAKAEEYGKVQQEIGVLSGEMKRLNENADSILSAIRALWLPFCAGATKCELKLDNGHKLDMRQVLNVSTEEKDKAIEWFRANGYEGVMKWDIHHATMKSIATELFNDPENPREIPGLKYTPFQNVKVK